MKVTDRKILNGRPWLFDNYLFSFIRYNGLTPPHLMDFKKVAFWIQFHHQPLACMNCEVGRQIGQTIGKVEEVDVAGDSVGWGRYLRVRIGIDVEKPLARDCILQLKGKEI